MRYYEIIAEQENLMEFNLLQKGLASLAIAGGLAITGFHNKIKPDQQLTAIGRKTISTLPQSLQKRLGDPNTIIFVKGMPNYGDPDPNAICQVGKGERVIYVNPDYVDKFMSDAGDQLSAHELTHIAQDSMDKKYQDRVPGNDPDRSKMYGQMTSQDAWKILSKAREQGKRMWDYSREEQGMIVQQRQAQIDLLRNLSKPEQISLAKQKIAVYNKFIDDLDDE
jgi:hypothetical protein